MSEEWPQVSVLIITYKRLNLALRCIQGLAKNLEYPGPLHFHVADDGSPPGHVEALVGAIRLTGRAASVTASNSARAGVGVSMNLGQRECWSRSNYVLWLEDDWELYQFFNLRTSVKVLAECQDVGMIRLGYLQRGISGTLKTGGGDLWWRLAWPPESEDAYVFAGHAALRHRRFYDAYGEYAEGLAPGETEAEFAVRVNNARGPVILWPGWVGCWGLFGHIGAESLAGIAPGTDWQGEETRQTPTEGIGAPRE